MFLEQLRVYSDVSADQRPPKMYQPTAIRYVIVLDQAGELLGVDETVGVGRERNGLIHLAPHIKRNGVCPKLLVDTAEYVFGMVGEKGQEAARKKHRAFVDLIEDCARETGVPSLQAILRFLNTLHCHREAVGIETRDKAIKPTANVTFRVMGGVDEYLYPFEIPVIQEYWARYVAATGEDDESMQCLVCGKRRPPVERLTIPIKGIPGGQATGMSIVSADKAACWSYGLRNSLIAPTCEACGEAFANALNSLLRDDNTHLVIPPLAYVFWCREPATNAHVKRLLQAEPAEVRNLLLAASRAKTDNLYTDPNAFYAASLSASGARVVARDWIETSVGAFHANMSRFFRLQGILSRDGENEYFPVWRLVKATVNQDTKEEPLARVGQAIMRMALHGGALPRYMLHAVIRRVRAQRDVHPAQASLVKLILLSQVALDSTEFQRGLKPGCIDQTYIAIPVEEKEDSMTTTEENEKNPAYICGRLFALLDYIQYRALGKVNASIGDRYYGTASSAPAVVFPRLIRGAQPHLAALRQGKDANYYMSYLDRELAALMADLPEFPRALSLESQGWFALGYYHQRVSIFKKRPSNGDGALPKDVETGEEEEIQQQDMFTSAS